MYFIFFGTLYLICIIVCVVFWIRTRRVRSKFIHARSRLLREQKGGAPVAMSAQELKELEQAKKKRPHLEIDEQAKLPKPPKLKHL